MPTSVETLEGFHDLLQDADPDGDLATCHLRVLDIGAGALDRVADVVAGLLGERVPASQPPRLVLLVDRAAILRDGHDVKDAVERQLAERYAVQRVVLDDGHPELHVSEQVTADATTACEGADVVVALGGGTISDIGKVAAATAEGAAPVLVSVQTAASVDGYTDDVSVVLRDGVKRTVPTRWPDAVLADDRVVAQAPSRMTSAGFGEMTSMLTAPADWRLASLVGTETRFHLAPLRLLDAVGEGMADWAPGVGRSEPEAVERLTRALAVRGIVTGVAGTTAVLSGVEHLVSHMLDLHQLEAHLPMGMHGAQVGVAGLVGASAWELLDERLRGAGGTPRLRADLLEPAAAEARVRATFGHLGGQIAGECLRDYEAKLAVVRRRVTEVDALLAGWDGVRDELLGLLRPSASLAAMLTDAGAATTFEALDPSIDADLAAWAVGGCALMRNRFTVVDLLQLLGWWEPGDVAEVIERAATVGGRGGAS